jgi:thiamine-phosphate pyrophosphorylase
VFVPRFHLITPVVRPSLLRSLVAEGVDAIQVRDKLADDRALLRFASAVVEAIRPLGGLVIVNDRIDIALAAGADGVHLGERDLPVRAARRMAPRLLVGATCRSRESVEAAREDGASYAGVGPVFRSTTKHGLPDPLGLSGLTAVAGVLPMVAISGITAATVPEVLRAGAHGVAVVAAVSRAADPPAAAREIAAALRAA